LRQPSGIGAGFRRWGVQLAAVGEGVVLEDLRRAAERGALGVLVRLVVAQAVRALPTRALGGAGLVRRLKKGHEHIFESM
jgi:hypothetical protein